MYYTVLDATDTNTVGPLVIFVHITAEALPVRLECIVYDGPVYDGMIAVGGALPANVTQVSGDGPAADNAEKFFDGTGYGPLILGTGISSVASQTQLTLDYSNLTDALIGCRIIIRRPSTGQTTTGVITSTATGEDVFFTHDGTAAFTIADTDIVEILPAAFGRKDRELIDTEVAAILDDTGTTGVQIPNGEIVAGTFAEGAIDNTAFSVTETLTANPAMGGIVAGSFVSGAINAAAIATDAIDADAIATNAIGDLEWGVSEVVNSNVTQWASGVIPAQTIAGVPEVDITHVAGQLASAVSGAIDANVVKYNGTPGTFSAGRPEIIVQDNGITAAKIATDAIGAAELASDAANEIISQVSATADSGSTTTLVDAALTQADTDYWAGSWLLITSGNTAGQIRKISAFTPSSDTITVATAFTQPIGTNTYMILRTARAD